MVPVGVEAISTAASQALVAQEVGISVMNMAMDTNKQQAQAVQELLTANTQMMERSVNPHLGSMFDAKV